MATSALCLNLLVAGTAFFVFWKGAHFSWSLTRPFIAASIPAAFLGGLLKVPPQVYAVLLAFVLFFASFRLFVNLESEKDLRFLKVPSLAVALPAGAGVGVLSGVVGVGGGIFLSPLLLFLHWASPKQTAATSALFIFANSFAGLAGRFVRQDFWFSLASPIVFMIAAAFLGGLVGSRFGANHFPGQWLKRILALVLVIAAFKLFWSLSL
jgi:hypothetical protein